jgi:hypothetical protein
MGKIGANGIGNWGKGHSTLSLDNISNNLKMINK